MKNFEQLYKTGKVQINRETSTFHIKRSLFHSFITFHSLMLFIIVMNTMIKLMNINKNSDLNTPRTLVSYKGLNSVYICCHHIRILRSTSIVTQDGVIDTEINNRRNKANRIYYFIYNTIFVEIKIF